MHKKTQTVFHALDQVDATCTIIISLIYCTMHRFVTFRKPRLAIELPLSSNRDCFDCLIKPTVFLGWRGKEESELRPQCVEGRTVTTNMTVGVQFFIFHHLLSNVHTYSVAQNVHQ